MDQHPDYVPVYYHAALLAITQSEPDRARTIVLKGVEKARAARDYKAVAELEGLLEEGVSRRLVGLHLIYYLMLHKTNHHTFSRVSAEEEEAGRSDPRNYYGIASRQHTSSAGTRN